MQCLFLWYVRIDGQDLPPATRRGQLSMESERLQRRKGHLRIINFRMRRWGRSFCSIRRLSLRSLARPVWLVVSEKNRISLPISVSSRYLWRMFFLDATGLGRFQNDLLNHRLDPGWLLTDRGGSPTETFTANEAGSTASPRHTPDGLPCDYCQDQTHMRTIFSFRKNHHAANDKSTSSQTILCWTQKFDHPRVPT